MHILKFQYSQSHIAKLTVKCLYTDIKSKSLKANARTNQDLIIWNPICWCNSICHPIGHNFRWFSTNMSYLLGKSVHSIYNSSNCIVVIMVYAVLAKQQQQYKAK